MKKRRPNTPTRDHITNTVGTPHFIAEVSPRLASSISQQGVTPVAPPNAAPLCGPERAWSPGRVGGPEGQGGVLGSGVESWGQRWSPEWS